MDKLNVILRLGLIICIIATTITLVETGTDANLALNKPANQSGTVNTANHIFGPHLAVDGNLTGTSVAIPDADQVTYTEYALWWVDLEDTYRVQNITIYNAEGYGNSTFLINFILSVGPDLSTLADCGPEWTEDIPQGGNITIPCDQVGRIVHFRRTGNGTAPNKAPLREVLVYGAEQYSCAPCPPDTPCDPDTGCSQCAPGKVQSPECETDCTVGSYGLDCSHQCGQCAQPEDCSIVDGVCSGECRSWWVHDQCDKEIVIPNRTDETVMISEVSNSSLKITWQQIQSLDPELYEYYGYSVLYKNSTSPSYSEGTPSRHSGTGNISTVLSGLMYYQEYETKIVPYRTNSEKYTRGTPYPTTSANTYCGYPDPPGGVNASAEDSSDNVFIIHVTWNNVSSPEVDSRCDNISGLRVDHRMKDDGDWTGEDVPVTATECEINITDDGEHEVRVVSINNQQYSASSEVVTVIVGKLSPGPNVAVIVSVVVVLVVLVVAAGTVTFYLLKIRNNKEPTGNRNIKRSPEVNLNFETDINFEPGNHSEIVFVEQPTNLAGKKPVPKIKPGIKPRQHKPAHVTYENLMITEEPDLIFGIEDVWEKDNIKRSAEFDLGAIGIKKLDMFTEQKTADENKFGREYESLPPDNLARCKMGQTNDNKVKNRFKNIFPYDDTRVLLRPDSQTGTSDYINANYITGFFTDREYIATQGPRPETVDDMWMMIWQENVNRIVMLVNLTEGGKKRCTEYWPMGRAGSSCKFGDFYITLETEDSCADYTHRVLKVTDGDVSRRVHHYHFTTWEDKNNPVYGAITLFAFHRMVHSVDSISTGPMVVHCSAGVGRTGTFIAFDILVNQGHKEGQVDIYKCVQRLRQERMTMVQTKDQYLFLHEALAEYFKIGRTSFNPNEIPKQADIQRQFKVLRSFASFEKRHDLDGLKPENANKNRDPDIIADDFHRPYLNTVYEDGTNYINAVIVSSYNAHKQYIVTQLPLPDTIVDFWRLVHEQNCRTIVMINPMDIDKTCVDYWPKKEHPHQTFGPIEVELMDTNKITNTVTTRNFNVKLAPTKYRSNTANTRGLTVRQFQLLSWPKELDLPASDSHLLDLMEPVQSWQQQEGLRPPQSHILVHCLDGTTRSGLYCALAYAMNKMQSEQVVDPFMAVRAVSRSRPQFVNSMAQYKFLYETVSARAANHSEYENVN